MRETFIKRYIVESTSKAEIRPVEQSEKAESCLEDLWNEMQLKGTPRKTEKDTRTIKRVGTRSCATSPQRDGESAGPAAMVILVT